MKRGGPLTEDLALPAPIMRCTVCGSEVDRCSLCGTGFLKEHAIRCRREDGHDHDACATARPRRTSSWPPPTSSGVPPPPSGLRSRDSRFD